MFGASDNFDVEGSGKQSLQPGIYKGEIVSIAKGKKESGTKDNKKVEITLDIVYKSNEPDKEGSKVHVDQLKPSTDPEKVASTSTQIFEKMMHIARCFLSDVELAKAIKTKHKDFDSFIKWCSELPYKGVGVTWKVIGDTFNNPTTGKETLVTKIPGFSAAYKQPFIYPLASGMKPNFTNGELEGNTKYRDLFNTLKSETEENIEEHTADEPESKPSGKKLGRDVEF